MTTPSPLRVIPKLLTIIAASTLIGVSISSAAIIYQEDFSGGNTGLNNTSPDVLPEGSSATWVAGSAFRENGAYTGVGNVGQSAWLPYTFENGQIYEATLSISLISSSNTSWFSLGFSNRETLIPTLMNGTDQAGPGAMGWAILRQNGNWLAFNGPGTNPAATGIGGTGMNDNPSPFGDSVTNATIRLVLDTRGPRYLLDLYINDVHLDLAGTGLTYTFPTAQQFTGVGIGSSNSDIGTFQQFTFSVIPEPSSVALLAFGSILAIGVLRRARRA